MVSNTENPVENLLKEKARPYKNLSSALKILESDSHINGLLVQANKVAISRLGYNDHGHMHSRITAYNALKILELLEIQPTVVSEEIGNKEDSMVAVLIGSFLHDCGISVVREGHELIGTIVAKESVNWILRKIYKDDFKIARMASVILECILCHMGTYRATSWEARIVETADGTDASKGRARVPLHIGKADIHKFSALAIEKIDIIKGQRKPVRFEIFMDNPAGVFQAEEIMKKKVIDAEMENYVEIIANIKDKKPLVIL